MQFYDMQLENFVLSYSFLGDVFALSLPKRRSLLMLD
ncbi:Uncharacterised protein [Bergeyella zoohelcum]|uniref:Uncharacterized protein n=1 Tax=Bergeyella zoohelcum TaxID=1015 RepID=A0A376BXS4_9FLAO|nr:Uncharacterised protein [Bergeyella zoohelcum]